MPPPLDEVDGLAAESDEVDGLPLDGLPLEGLPLEGLPLGGLAEIVGPPPEPVFELEAQPAITAAAASNAATGIARGDR